jgi:hypothetical protein
MTSVADLGVKRRLITVEAYHRYRELRAGAYAKIENTDRPDRLRLAAAPEIEIDLTGLFA